LSLWFILGRCGLVQHSPHLSFLAFRQRRRPGCLGLKQGSEEHAVVQLRTHRAEIAMIDAIAHVLSLEHLCLPLTAMLAHHAEVYSRGGTSVGTRRAEHEGPVADEQQAIDGHGGPAQTVDQTPELSGEGHNEAGK
jgi:hypothetical protein